MPDAAHATIEQRLAILRSRMATALIGQHHKAQEVTLVAVSKGQTTEAIRHAYALGVRDFGESYAQEFLKKADELSDLKEIRWHFIGHVQSNKIKKIVPFNPVVHTLDRTSLLNELVQFISPAAPLRIMIQLQIDPTDVSKFGCTLAEADELCQRVAQTPGLLWDGFMGIGPANATPERLKWMYDEFNSIARHLWERYSRRDPSRKLPDMKLSLGMSDDLEIAIRSGSNLVRVGSALFGPRPPKNVHKQTLASE
jgi:pyridoxal phosphate enzyme (YggS family)